MNLEPLTQKKLFGLNDNFSKLIGLYKKKKLPNKILLSGPKGSGKCTLAYHLINYILSEGENLPYDLTAQTINENNKSFKLVNSKTHPNFYLLDSNFDKKTIEISKIRELIKNLNQSSFNNKPRIILIDNIEYLNVHSINALLKILEEPNLEVYFILINNDKKILSTLKSRCLNFRISLSFEESLNIINKLITDYKFSKIKDKLINHYITPGSVYNIIQFLSLNDIDFDNNDLREILLIIMNKNFVKKNSIYKDIVYNLFEFYLVSRKTIKNINLYNYFIKRINDTKNFSLDEELLFLEIKDEIINE